MRFAHVFETLLDEIRSGRKPCDDLTVKTLLRASDLLVDHVAAARGQGPAVDEVRSAGLVAELEILTHGDGAVDPAPAPIAAPAEPEPDEFGFRPCRLRRGQPGCARRACRRAHGGSSSARIRECTRTPTRPACCSANWAVWGDREQVTLDCSELPDLAALVAEEAYLTWTIDIETSVGEPALREVFDFVESDCDLSVTPVAAVSAAAPAADDFDLAALLARAQAESLRRPTP